MAFDTYEQSIQSGEPIELYEFARGGLRWRYTSAKQDITYNALTWTAAILDRTEISMGTEKGRSGLTVTCPRDFPVAELFRIQPPSDVVLLNVLKMHYPDNVAPVAVVEWMGRVINADWAGAKAKLVCEPVSTSMARPGLRRLYQRACPHVLYSTACGVDRSAHAVVASLSAVNGAVISSLSFGAHSDGHFSGGFIEYAAPDGTVERRYILEHTGGDLTLSIPLAALVAGVQVTAYPGCPHTTTACRLKFNNILNYGGFPYIPGKNPFSGSAIY